MESLIENYVPGYAVKHQVDKALKSKPDNFYEKYGKPYDISNLVSPYYVNQHQRQMLTDIIGKSNVDDIEMMNALVYSGVINAECPPRGDPTKSQMYADPVTGRVQCRRPMPSDPTAWNWQYTNADGTKQDFDPSISCPSENGNPLATEKYIDAYGRTKCRVPVIRGDFSCPSGSIRTRDPNMQAYLGSHTQGVTLSDGTGVCVEPENISSSGLYPTGLVNQSYAMLYGDSVYDRMKGYVNYLDDVGGNVDMLMQLGRVVRESTYADDFASKISRDPMLSVMMPIANSIKNPEDLKVFSAALYEHLKEKHPRSVGGMTYSKFMKGGAKKNKKSKARRRRR